MRDGSATAVRPGADIGSGTVDAADAQDSAGLLLFARANQLFLVRHDTRLVDGLARLEPPGGLRPAGSGRADRLGVRGGRASARLAAPRRRHPGFPLPLGAGGACLTSNGAFTTRSRDAFSSPPKADQTSEIDRSCGGGIAMFSVIGCRVWASAPLSTSAGMVWLRRKQRSNADSRRCSSSGRCVHAVTR